MMGLVSPPEQVSAVTVSHSGGLADLFTFIDTDHDGIISHAELCSSLPVHQVYLPGSDEDRLATLLEEAHPEGITLSQFRTFFQVPVLKLDIDKALRIVVNVQQARADLERAPLLKEFRRWDTDGDGVLTQDDFLRFISKYKPSCSPGDAAKMFDKALEQAPQSVRVLVRDDSCVCGCDILWHRFM